MSTAITAITLPSETVSQALAAWLNLHVLRTPHTVTSIESDGETYSIALAPEPAPEGRRIFYPEIGVTTTADDLITHLITCGVLPCEPATNGNGHCADEPVGAGLVPAPASDEEAAPVTQAAPKKHTRGRFAVSPDDIAAIQSLHENGLGATKIAQALGLGRSTVNRYLGLIRRGAATDGGL